MNNINTINRVLRVVLSLGIVVVVLGMTGPVGNLAYAFLVSIYAGLTGFIGWDPAIALMDRLHKKVTDKADHTHHNHLLHH
jgi:hypothetical protein